MIVYRPSTVLRLQLAKLLNTISPRENKVFKNSEHFYIFSHRSFVLEFLYIVQLSQMVTFVYLFSPHCVMLLPFIF